MARYPLTKDTINLFWKLAIWLILVIIMTVFVFFITDDTSASAAPVENEDPGIANGIFDATYTRLPDDSNAHYHIDISDATPEQAENSTGENFMDSLQNFNPVGNTINSTIMEYLNVVTNLGLQWNMMFTNMMIGMMNFGFETEIIDSWITAMSSMVEEMTGIRGTDISGGIFGSLLTLAIVASAAAALFQFVTRRALISGFGILAKTVLALAVSFLIIANFAPLMTGMNTISTQISAGMMTGTANMIGGSDRAPEEIRQEVSANLWNEFIGRPYMILQYGSDDIERIGEDRVNELLAMPKGEDRQEFVEEIEIGERGNETMTYASVIDRLAFTGIYSAINALVSLPIYALALAMIIFQLWFLMIAFIAPFVLIQSVFPGQFGVLRRYAVELIYPLVCKVIVTVATLFIFTLGFMIYSIEINVGISRYFVSAFMQFALFGVFFFGRKRIASILSAGNRGPFESLRYDINGLKTSMTDAANQIGSVTKTIGTVGMAAATGGTSAALTTAATEGGKAVLQRGEAPPEEVVTDTNHSRPMVRVEQAEADHAPEERETAAQNSQPLASINEVRGSDPVTAAEPEARLEETPIEPTRGERDLSAPLATIEDVEPKTEIVMKEEAEKKEGGLNE